MVYSNLACRGRSQQGGESVGESVVSAATTFRVVLLKPSHYDDEGYVIRWMRSCIPSNTLACLYTITEAVKTFGASGARR